jgi:hypothetical protein
MESYRAFKSWCELPGMAKTGAKPPEAGVMVSADVVGVEFP